MNTKFLDEAKEFKDRWNKSGSPYLRATTAKDMECQRLMNEVAGWDCCDECREKEKRDYLSWVYTI